MLLPMSTWQFLFPRRGPSRPLHCCIRLDQHDSNQILITASCWSDGGEVNPRAIPTTPARGGKDGSGFRALGQRPLRPACCTWTSPKPDRPLPPRAKKALTPDCDADFRRPMTLRALSARAPGRKKKKPPAGLARKWTAPYPPLALIPETVASTVVQHPDGRTHSQNTCSLWPPGSMIFIRSRSRQRWTWRLTPETTGTGCSPSDA